MIVSWIALLQIQKKNIFLITFFQRGIVCLFFCLVLFLNFFNQFRIFNENKRWHIRHKKGPHIKTASKVPGTLGKLNY